MKEIRYWEADDGTKFDDRYECKQYEQRQCLTQCQNDFQFFGRDKKLIPIEEATTDRVDCIIVKTPAAAQYI